MNKLYNSQVNWQKWIFREAVNKGVTLDLCDFLLLSNSHQMDFRKIEIMGYYFF